MLNRLLTAGLTAVSITFALCDSTVASNLAVNDSNASLLEGTWAGEATSVNEDNQTPYYNDMQLTIENASPLRGEFKDGYGNDWHTPVVLLEGKVILAAYHAQRKFTLVRGDDNTLKLTAHFTREFGGHDFDTTINLKKKGKP